MHILYCVHLEGMRTYVGEMLICANAVFAVPGSTRGNNLIPDHRICLVNCEHQVNRRRPLITHQSTTGPYFCFVEFPDWWSSFRVVHDSESNVLSVSTNRLRFQIPNLNPRSPYLLSLPTCTRFPRPPYLHCVSKCLSRYK